MTRTAKLLIALFTAVLQAAACSSSAQEQMHPIGPDAKASFVIYFQRDATREQIKDFSDNVLSRPRTDGRGEDMPEGVQSILLVSADGHKGYAINFFENATPEQRGKLIAAVKASPLVYKVFEGVTPDDVKKID